MLCRLIYASRTTAKADAAAIDNIVEVARARNELRDITGVLVFNADFFMQVLEGERAVLNGLLRQIWSDERHSDLQILEMTDISERRFVRWSMGFVRADTLGRSTLLKYSPTSHFDPYRLTADGAYKLLLDYADSAV